MQPSIFDAFRHVVVKEKKRPNPEHVSDDAPPKKLKLPENSETEVLRKVFGMEALRPMQRKAIDAWRAKKDVCVIAATGGGKSLIYQLPPLLTGGWALVVSPLVSLMLDQSDSLNAAGIKATFLGSAQTDWRKQQEVEAGKIQIVYCTPEKLLNWDGLKRAVSARPLALVAVDEAHCVSDWGHDFRPSYRRIAEVRGSIIPSRVPWMALTATATEAVRADIVASLGLRDPVLVQTSVERTNLSYSCMPRTSNVVEDLAKALDIDDVSKLRDVVGPTIVYCPTIKEVERVESALKKAGVSVGAYHSQTRDRTAVHRAFVADNLTVVVATVAFGMGINKPDVRAVVHYGLSKCLAAYSQESGRAGRDGAPSRCVLFYGASDLNPGKIEFMLEGKTVEERDRSRMGLQRVWEYAHSSGCRTAALVRHFGQTPASERCGRCDNCARQRANEQANGHANGHEAWRDDAAVLLRVVRDTGGRFGMRVILDVAQGRRGANVTSRGFDRLKCHGIAREGGVVSADSHWTALFHALAAEPMVIESRVATSSGFNSKTFTTYSIGRRGRAVLEDDDNDDDSLRLRLTLPASVEAECARRASVRGGVEVDGDAQPGSSSSLSADEHELLQRLRACRKRLAREHGLPPYCVFSEKTLAQMARLKPRDGAALRAVHGVGEAKLARFGQAFLVTIESHGCSFFDL